MSKFNVTFGDKIENPYILPVATFDTLGGVKIGNGLNINEGVLSVNYIKIAQSNIEIGEQSVTINYTGTIIGLMAWQNNNFVLTNLNCNVSNESVIFNIAEPVTDPINCMVIYF